jgi:hypothetical protein
VATASRYGFALRKIVESVAMGATPITDLPAYDVLPEIDQALVRISPVATLAELKEAIDTAERAWNLDRALYFAESARHFYDYRKIGKRLDRLILEARAIARAAHVQD